MYVYFGSDGVLKEIISEPIRQGNVKLNQIYFYWENMPEVATFWATFKKPDGTYTNETEVGRYVSSIVPYSSKRDLKYFEDYKKYTFVVVDIPDEVLTENGLALCSIRAVLNENTTQTLGLITFNIEDSVIKKDSYITQSQYNYLIQLVGDKATWEDIQNYIGVSKTDVIPYDDFVGYLKEVVFKQNTDDIQTLFNLYSSIIGFNYQIVNDLPTQGSTNVLYWLNKGSNIYDIYIYSNNEYKKLFTDINFNANNFPTLEEYNKNTAHKLEYHEDGFTLINQNGEDVLGQDNKVKLATINSKNLTEEESLQVFEAGGEVEDVEDTDYRASKEAMLEPYVIDISERNTINYAEYSIFIRLKQNYLIYNDSILRFEYDSHQGYYYYGDSIEVMISKTENSDKSHNIVVKRLNRVGKMFITGTNIYVSAIIALDNTAKGDSRRIVPGDYVAAGTYSGKTVYKLKLNVGSYREVYLTDGSAEVVGEADVSVEEL